jgi:beta-phosphoglucomutase family hydrolase
VAAERVVAGNVSIDRRQFEAFAFDLDGVVTKTADVHVAAWKRALDELLARRADGAGWRPFDVDREYRIYLDGRPRRDGIRNFLEARGIALAEGRPGDSPDTATVFGVAARKNHYFLDQLSRAGVEVYPDATLLIGHLHAHAIRTAVVSSSENCAAILDAANITAWFDVRVDGLDISRLWLHGKPAPDSFLEAARRLGTEPRRCVVVDDALAGVRAGRAGGFGLVVGVDRVGHAGALRRSGADVVVTALDQLALTGTGEEGARP